MIAIPVHARLLRRAMLKILSSRNAASDNWRLGTMKSAQTRKSAQTSERLFLCPVADKRFFLVHYNVAGVYQHPPKEAVVAAVASGQVQIVDHASFDF